MKIFRLTALFGNDQREWKNMLTNSVDQVENMSSPRCIKTHLPWDLLPTQINTVKPKVTNFRIMIYCYDKRIDAL